jgi:hypothetical protein
MIILATAMDGSTEVITFDHAVVSGKFADGRTLTVELSHEDLDDLCLAAAAAGYAMRDDPTLADPETRRRLELWQAIFEVGWHATQPQPASAGGEGEKKAHDQA